MIRKILFTIAAIAACAVGAGAQGLVGDWNIYPLYSGEVSYIAESPSMVYYTCSSRLFSYDKESHESYSYNTRNKLSDTNIAGAYYNYDGRYVMLAYDTGNIDLVYDDGRVVNMPDILNAQLTYTKGIRDAAFYKGKIYVATDFGLVIFDDSRHEVSESGIFGKAVDCVTIVDDHIVMFMEKGVGNDYSLWSAPVTGRHNAISKFVRLGGTYVKSLVTVGTKAVGVNGNDNKPIIYNIDWNTNKFKVENGVDVVVGDIVVTPQSAYYITSGEIVVLDGEGKAADRHAIPDELKNDKIATYSGLNSVWAAGPEGLGNYDISGATLTVLADRIKPVATTCDNVAFIRTNSAGNKIYISNLGVTNYKSIITIGDIWWIPQHTNVIEGGVPRDISLTVASADNSTVKKEQEKRNTTAMLGGVTRFVVDPDNDDRYYIGNNFEGVYVIENDKEIAKFNEKNSPMYAWWGVKVHDVNIDPEGNLWVGAWTLSNTQVSPYYILPKAKLKGDLSTITKDDWIATKHLGNDVGNKDMGSLICRKSNMVFTWHSKFGNPVCAYDTKGTYTNTSDDVFYEISDMIDQDGKTFSCDRITCAIEDQRGRVWVGTTSGPFEITNPSKATDPTSRITRLKVPRNDGTNYADYLLDTEQINDMSIDAANRKWIATENSGVYLVSENGDQIIAHYTTDNSALPSNTIYSVLCSPVDNVVYFGLKTGLVSFNSTSSPAADTYDNVYAYPNPVRPDYTGWITITGLMDQSLVKIADAAGNVIYQTRSNGGMVTWDGCDTGGNRVRSGVYYVFASQNATGSSEGAVTKIVVIN